VLGVLTDVSGSQRVGVSVVVALFVLGLLLLLPLDERAGSLARTPQPHV
jgi:MFS-type transporter involved in bile tolerance (Atg22 family)